MATIGDWEVLIQEDKQLPKVPGDPSAGTIRILTYNFTYVPRNFTLPNQVIWFSEFQNDDRIREYLVDRLAVLKTAIVDRLPN